MSKPMAVDVICMYDTEGEIRPLRLRLYDEQSQGTRMDIQEILGIERNGKFGSESITFVCRGVTEMKKQVLELRYSVRNHSWHVLRLFGR